MKETTILAVCGKTASGKDTLCRAVADDLGPAAHLVKRTTTRPMRISEFADPPYRFITDNDFTLEERKGEFLETSKFRGWRYGTSVKEIESGTLNVMALDVGTLKRIRKTGAADSILVVFIDEPLSVRIKRYIARNGGRSFEMCRRMLCETFRYIGFKRRLDPMNSLILDNGRGVVHKKKEVKKFLEQNYLI